MISLSGNRARITATIFSVVAILALYPVALALVVAFDSLTGSGAFIDEMLYGSKRRLMQQIAHDWVESAFWWLSISVLVLLGGILIGSTVFRNFSVLAGIVIIAFGLLIPSIPLLLASTAGMALILPAIVIAR